MVAEASVALALWRNLDALYIGSILHRPEKVRGLVLRPRTGKNFKSLTFHFFKGFNV
jgi:hypothetical protein